jgi:hypothetical protein
LKYIYSNIENKKSICYTKFKFKINTNKRKIGGIKMDIKNIFNKIKDFIKNTSKKVVDKLKNIIDSIKEK